MASKEELLKRAKELAENENLTASYLQNKDISRDFATYYELYRRYNELYKIPDILEGRFPEDKKAIRDGSFDEKLSIIGLLTDKLMEEFIEYARQQAIQKELFEIIKEYAGKKSNADNATLSDDGNKVTTENSAFSYDKNYFVEKADLLEKELADNLDAGLISREDEKIKRLVIALLHECHDEILRQSSGAAITADDEQGIDIAKSWFNQRESGRQDQIKRTGTHLTNSFEFLEETFGDSESLSGSQEMVIFLTELSKAYHSLKFVRETGNEAYYRYNKLLLLNDRKQELKELAENLIF